MSVTWRELRPQLIRPEDEERIAAIRAQYEAEIEQYRQAHPEETEAGAEQ